MPLGCGSHRAAQVTGSDYPLFSCHAHPLMEVLISWDTAQYGSQVQAAWGSFLAPQP